MTWMLGDSLSEKVTFELNDGKDSVIELAEDDIMP